MPKAQPPELKKFMDKKLTCKLFGSLMLLCFVSVCISFLTHTSWSTLWEDCCYLNCWLALQWFSTATGKLQAFFEASTNS